MIPPPLVPVTLLTGSIQDRLDSLIFINVNDAVQAMQRPLTGTPSQIEWAEQIRLRVGADFDRVAAAFRSVAATQAVPLKSDTEAIIAILAEKRAEVMANPRAGYFIHQWQELSDQVRRMIREDSRYQTIKANRRLTKS